jgi:hypothetical protein
MLDKLFLQDRCEELIGQRLSIQKGFYSTQQNLQRQDQLLVDALQLLQRFELDEKVPDFIKLACLPDGNEWKAQLADMKYDWQTDQEPEQIDEIVYAGQLAVHLAEVEAAHLVQPLWLSTESSLQHLALALSSRLDVRLDSCHPSRVAPDVFQHWLLYRGQSAETQLETTLSNGETMWDMDPASRVMARLAGLFVGHRYPVMEILTGLMEHHLMHEDYLAMLLITADDAMQLEMINFLATEDDSPKRLVRALGSTGCHKYAPFIMSHLENKALRADALMSLQLLFGDSIFSALPDDLAEQVQNISEENEFSPSDINLLIETSQRWYQAALSAEDFHPRMLAGEPWKATTLKKIWLNKHRLFRKQASFIAALMDPQIKFVHPDGLWGGQWR